MAESHKHSQTPPEAKRPAPAAGCFGIQAGDDLHEAERRVAAERDRPSLEEFAEHYFDLGYKAALAERRKKFESAH